MVVAETRVGRREGERKREWVLCMQSQEIESAGSGRESDGERRERERKGEKGNEKVREGREKEMGCWFCEWREREREERDHLVDLWEGSSDPARE